MGSETQAPYLTLPRARSRVSDNEDPDVEDYQNREAEDSLTRRPFQYAIDSYQLPSASSNFPETVAEELSVPDLNVLNTQVPFRLFQRLFAFELIRTVTSSKWAMADPLPVPKQQGSKLIDEKAECSCTENIKHPKSGGNYRELELTQKEIRLLKLFPSSRGDQIQASFVYTDLSTCPAYTALSYTWGEDTGKNLVKILGSSTVSVRANLWDFLCQQAKELDEPKLFWIDAVCIDQDDTHERNHQVKIMKDIYVNAVETYVWLGKEANGSDLAMDFIREKGTVGLRPKGAGFHNLWRKEQGQALCELLSRAYWRRMWIVQEVTHSQRIIVGCGSKNFNWESLEAFYLTLKELEDSNWLTHHRYATEIFQSPACTMVWQRAYWRHPETSAPALTDLIELFQEWKCTDVRDKVYALVNMASPETRIEPDYSSTARDIFLAVRDKYPFAKPHFFSLLFQMLGIPGREVDCHHLTMIEYRVESPETVLLRRKWRELEHKDVTFDNGKFDGE